MSYKTTAMTFTRQSEISYTGQYHWRHGKRTISDTSYPVGVIGYDTSIARWRERGTIAVPTKKATPLARGGPSWHHQA
ncbi:hypothetical protein HHA04nite_08230 [Halomonas halophila]|uniref:Uncharacterized protein n=1 Tax=Halomonas halophila TaxID=29573 RepID=A0ABQ0U148_9GAMM|nr:hypothetical protein HHA04nite_08230 [Halomonas halophila]